MKKTKEDLEIQTRNITVVGFEGVEILDIVGPLEVFAMAGFLLNNQYPDRLPAYHLSVLAKRKGVFRAYSGINLFADASWRRFTGPVDTLFIAGGPDMTPLTGNPDFIDWVLKMEKKVRRLCSICTGSFVLAQAGLLNGKRATTHWITARELQNTYPQITVDCDALYIRDGHLATSAGITWEWIWLLHSSKRIMANN